MNDEETLELLREAHREPIAEAHYAAVRARVLAKLAARRRWWRMCAYGFASVAVAAMLLIAFRPAHSNVGQALRPADRTLAQAAPAAALQVEQDAAVHSTVGRRKRPPRQAPMAHRVIGPPVAQPLVVKLVTDDPNIVIYWISGE